jgi:hypothetical protein
MHDESFIQEKICVPKFCLNDDFPCANEVWVGFKRSEKHNHGHWLNAVSLYFTRRRGDVPPAGMISHVEIMLQIKPGDWRRWSIGKQRQVRNDQGELVWGPGCVHFKDANLVQNEYIFQTFRVSRKQQEDMYNFLQSQVGATFNTMGYFYNFWTFGYAFGTRRYHSKLLKRRRKWFCTELIVIALQAGKVTFAMPLSACKVSPNELYRLCMKHSIPSTNPSKKIKIIL